MSINETLDKLASLPAGRRLYRSTANPLYDELLDLTTDDLKELAEELRGVREMLAEAEWIEFGEGRRIAQPCRELPTTDQCWHDQDENLYDSPLEAFQSLKEKQK